MKIRLFLTFILLFVVTGTGYGVGSQKRIRLQHDFELRLGRQAIVKEAGLKVTFVELVEDSRCPEGVDCIWAGNGKIKLTVRKGNRKSVTFELNTMTAPKNFTYQNYEISLVNLAPYPKINVETKKQDYVATLKVIKNKH